MSLQAIRLDAYAGPCLANVFDLRGPDFLLFYAILLLLGLTLAFVLRQLLRGPGEAGVDLGKGGALHPLEVAYLAGGPKSAIDAAAAALVHREVLMVTKVTHYLQPRGGPPPQDCTRSRRRFSSPCRLKAARPLARSGATSGPPPTG